MLTFLDVSLKNIVMICWLFLNRLDHDEQEFYLNLYRFLLIVIYPFEAEPGEISNYGQVETQTNLIQTIS